MNPNNEKIFNGYFDQPDYSQRELFCLSDAQTKPTPEILGFAEKINNGRTLSTLINIHTAIQKKFPCSTPENAKERRFDITAQDIFDRKRIEGCTDCAVLFATVARAIGFPCLILDSAHSDWINNQQTPLKGHVYLEVFVQNKWMLVDPSYSKSIYTDYNTQNKFLPNGFIAFAKGRSFLEMGVTDIISRKNFMASAFQERLQKYEDPNYKSISMEPPFKRIIQRLYHPFRMSLS